MENIASNPYDIPMNIDDPGASIENLIALIVLILVLLNKFLNSI